MNLFIDKDTDLMRSTFVAIGLAQLLNTIPPPNRGQNVTIQDMGSCFVVQSGWSEDQLREEITKTKSLPSLLPAIVKPLTATEKKQVEAGTSEEDIKLKYKPKGYPVSLVVDYGEKKKIADEAKKFRLKKGEVRSEDDMPRADPDFPVWAHLASYFGKGSAMRVGYPSVIHAWHAHTDEQALALFDLILGCYGDFPNQVGETRLKWEQEIYLDLDYADYELRPLISSLAAVSPSTSKGVSASAGFNMLSEDTPNTFWLEMYLAFTGFMKAAMPYTIGSDVVTYYPFMDELSLSDLDDIMKTYRDSYSAWTLYRNSNSMNRAKLDVLNTILFYKEMVAHFLNTYPEDDEDAFFDEPLGKINGLVGYYYKDISTQIPFDETIFARPAWLAASANAEQLEEAEQVLDTHYKIINSLRGPKFKLTSDELNIIDHYRRYTTRGEVMDWLRFAIAYGQYRFRKMTEFNYPVLDLTTFIRSFPMSQTDRTDYTEIVKDPDFQQIAKALYYATHYARWRKDVVEKGRSKTEKKYEKYPFRPKHGLSSDLLRNAHNPTLFLEELAKFITEYEHERASVQANVGDFTEDVRFRRPRIQPKAITRITELVSEYGSNIVAHLLVANGSLAPDRTEKVTVKTEVDENTTEIQPEDVQAIVELVSKYGSNIVAHLLVASGYAARFGRDDNQS